MELHVTIGGDIGAQFDEPFQVREFGDTDKVAGKIGRVVANFLRRTPFRRQPHKMVLHVIAHWTDALPAGTDHDAAAPAPAKRRKKARK